MAIEARARMIRTIAAASRRWQSWVWLAGLAGAGYITYLLVSGLMTPAVPTPPASNQMIMHDIRSQGQHGRGAWKFVADSSAISPDGYTTTYRKVRDATYYRDGKPAYKLTADTVTADTRTQNYSATGGVHVWTVSTAQPDDLRTDDAYCSDAAQTLTCPTPTRFVYNGTTLYTTNMTVNMRTGQTQLGETTIDYQNPSPSPGPSISPLQPLPNVSVGPQPVPPSSMSAPEPPTPLPTPTSTNRSL
jgi:lipopolysaccharide export system protein LptC